MPYYPNVPAANQRISASQPQIQTDFQQIQTTLGMDHVTFTDPGVANWGKHNVIKFQDQAAVVVPPPGATEINMFNQVPQAGGHFPLTGFNELFVRTDNGAGHQLTVPITAKSIYQDSSILGHSNWFYLPCGLLVKYGIQTTVAGLPPNFLINLDAIGVAYSGLPFGFATFTDMPVMQAASLVCRIINSSSLRVFSDDAGYNVSWIAIGPTASTLG